MKTVLVLCVALAVSVSAMPNPQEKVNVVDPGFYRPHGNTNGVNVVEQPSDLNGVNVINNPDPFFYQGGQGVNVIPNPDQGFYQPSFGPAYVQPTQLPYPHRPTNNPFERSGK